MDASCICLAPAASWVDFDSDDFQGFAIPGDTAVAENWAFAAPRGCALLAAWKREIERAWLVGFEEYCRRLPSEIKDGALAPHLPYLTSHACLEMARRTTPEVRVRLKSSIAPDGPFFYLSQKNWNSSRAILALWRRHPGILWASVRAQCRTAKAAHFPRTLVAKTNAAPFLKLRGVERIHWMVLQTTALGIVLFVFSIMLALAATTCCLVAL